MEYNQWNLASAIYNGGTGSLNIEEAYGRELLLSICRELYGNNGKYINNPDNRLLVLIALGKGGLYNYHPIKRIVGNCVITLDGSLIKLNGLDRYIDNYKVDGRMLVTYNNPYKLQTLSGFSVTGKREPVNEDNYACITHPQDLNLKFLMVADGMGGFKAGDRASHMLVDQMVGWFVNTDAYVLNDTKWLRENLGNVIELRNREIYGELVERQDIQTGTTLACAVINGTDMVHANVGDSRIAVLSDGQLKLASIDDSPNWRPGEEITETKLEAMRISAGNNKITQWMGIYSEVDPHIGVISNEEYTDVFIFSDGITDCVSYSTLNHIAQNMDTNNIFDFIKTAHFGERTPGAKSMGSDDATVVHYSIR